MPLNTVTGLLTRLSSSGRGLWTRQFGSTAEKLSIMDLCERLLSLRGESSAILVADEILERIRQHDEAENLAFFEYLLNDMQPDVASLSEAAQTYLNDPSPQMAAALEIASDAPRMTLFRSLSTSPRGPQGLVNMRQSLRKLLKVHPHLKPVDQGLVHLFRSWFNRGFLTLRKIDWTTPAHILEKLIQYEAVHEIDGWDDLRRRLAEDRRCYAFFHPSLGDEPLIFVEIALLPEMAGNIQAVIEQDGLGSAEDARAAIFYSISNCQPGLAGVSFGNYLIKQVAKTLSAELPQLTTYATLSPIPGFKRWVDSRDDINAENADSDTNMVQLCAHYLINEKRGTMPLDPVARFHLGNGARLDRINWNGDASENGQRQSYGIMVNYVYDLTQVEKNHEALVNDGVIATTTVIQKLATAAQLPKNEATA